ncbi:MAG: pilus assembly protein N-terminal domain-containing protein [Acidobacteria bacterium]|nr:pilus assembly protein N-terminal domain-containing protein [Acidobacteriota bacterium]MBI3422952.1 pilus assembly protein N-terminal domain-containing protein [Acidobacteriota bacterium]
MKFQHQKNRQVARLLWLLLVLLVGRNAVQAQAQERLTLQASFANNALPLKLDVLVGQTRVVDFDQPYERVAVSDSNIAEVVPVSEKQFLLNGLAFGQVNVVAWAKRPATEAQAGEPARLLIFDVYVQVNLTLIDNQIRLLFPNENIQLSQVPNGVVLSGSVSKPEMAEQVQKIVEATGLKVNNLLKAPVLDTAQVQLQLRIVEVERRLVRDLGVANGLVSNTVPAIVNTRAAGGPSGSGLGGGVDPKRPQGFGLANSSVNVWLSGLGTAGAPAFIRTLRARGALRELAEPTLIALDRQQASFQAGGEFPVPVLQPAGPTGAPPITVLFKEFGIKLNFQPTILDENHIRLALEPEVSSLDFSAGVTVQGLVIPGLRIRRAKTTLELRDGQSFVLAGLIDSVEQANLAKVPVLSQVPILGELFKSRSFQRHETELIFIVTVKTVAALNADQLPQVAATKPEVSKLPVESIEGQAGHALSGKQGPEILVQAGVSGPSKSEGKPEDKPETKTEKAPPKPPKKDKP